jgi:hypothetical protein
MVSREATERGILYTAEEEAGPFLDNLTSRYILELRARAEWVVDEFDHLSAEQLDALTKSLFRAWTTEFQPVQLTLPTDVQS